MLACFARGLLRPLRGSLRSANPTLRAGAFRATTKSGRVEAGCCATLMRRAAPWPETSSRHVRRVAAASHRDFRRRLSRRTRTPPSRRTKTPASRATRNCGGLSPRQLQSASAPFGFVFAESAIRSRASSAHECAVITGRPVVGPYQSPVFGAITERAETCGQQE